MANNSSSHKIQIELNRVYFDAYSIAVHLVSQKISFFDERSNVHTQQRRSLLDEYLTNPKLDLADIVGMACDLLLAGVDTVRTFSFTSNQGRIHFLKTSTFHSFWHCLDDI